MIASNVKKHVSKETIFRLDVLNKSGCIYSSLSFVTVVSTSKCKNLKLRCM